MKHALIAILVATATLPFRTAEAAPGRVFVAAQGSDANACTFASPCRTFQHAHDVVAAGGEIDVLDPAGYGGLTIAKAISIQGHGYAGVSAASGDVITVSAGSGKVNLRGLLLDGLGTAGDGVHFNSGALLNIQDCLIRNSSRGIVFSPSALSRLFVSNTRIADTGSTALEISPLSGGTAAVVIEDAAAVGSGSTGLLLNGSGQSQITISNSTIAHHAVNGIWLNFSGLTSVFVRNSTIADNSGVGLRASGSNNVIRLTHSSITGNGTGVLAETAGQVLSFGDNSLGGNTSDGAFTGAPLGLN
jgi:hypothetical protein